MMDLGQQIKQARTQKGLTQAQLADEMHVTRQTISNWENGRSVPDYVMLGQLAKLLQLNTVLSLPEEQDAAPIPQPKQKGFSKRWLMLSAAVLSLLVGSFGAIHWLAHKSPYTAEWFSQAQTAEEGKAFVRIYSLEVPVKARHNRPEATPVYQFNLFLKEENGVGCTIHNVTIVYFSGKKANFIDSLAQEDFIHFGLGSSYLGANQYRRMALNFPAGNETAIGFWVSGTDDNGNAFESRYYLPLAKE